MSVGILGSGLSGLAIAYHLVKSGVRCRIYDPNLPTQLPHYPSGFHRTASMVAAGLLHPLSPSLKLAWMGREAMEETRDLLEAAAKHDPTVLTKTPLLRASTGAQDSVTIRDAAERLPDELEYLNAEEFTAIAGSGTYRHGGARYLTGRIALSPSVLPPRI